MLAGLSATMLLALLEECPDVSNIVAAYSSFSQYQWPHTVPAHTATAEDLEARARVSAAIARLTPGSLAWRVDMKRVAVIHLNAALKTSCAVSRIARATYHMGVEAYHAAHAGAVVMNAAEAYRDLRRGAAAGRARQPYLDVVHSGSSELRHRVVKSLASRGAVAAAVVARGLVPVGDVQSSAPAIPGGWGLRRDGAAAAHLLRRHSHARASHGDIELLIGQRGADGAVRAGRAIAQRRDVPLLVVDVRASSIALGAATVRPGGTVLATVPGVAE